MRKEKNFFKTSLNCLVAVAYYLKLVFHLLNDKSVTPAEELLFINIIDSCIIR